MIAGALVLVVLAAGLACASEYSGSREFLRKWLVYTVAVVGIVAFGVLLGGIMRSALCASVWLCE